MTATIHELELAAQEDAEARLELCNRRLHDAEMDEEPIDYDYDHEDDPDGPYCGCDTCIVREVLDAAWPHLLALARLVPADA